MLYGHSTGGLEASLFLREGSQRDRISACILNSPFLDWGGASMLDVALDLANEVYPVVEKAMSFFFSKEQMEKKRIQTPKEPSALTTGLWVQYPCIDLRCRNATSNVLTAGWCKVNLKTRTR